MSDMIHEIKEEINQERLQRFFKNYLPYLAVAVITFIAIFGVSLWYNSHKLNNLYRDGGIYLSAINKVRAQNLEEGLKKFEEISNSHSNYGALAKFNLASYAIFNKEFAKGYEILNEITEDSSYHPMLRHLAELLRIQIAYESKKESAKDTMDKLEIYIKSNPEFKYSAQEFLAALYLKENKNEKAAKILDTLTTDPQVPQSITMRAQQYMALIK